MTLALAAHLRVLSAYLPDALPSSHTLPTSRPLTKMKLSAATVFAAFAAAQAASLPQAGLTANLYNRELSARQDIPAVCVRSCQPVNALLANVRHTIWHWSVGLRP